MTSTPAGVPAGLAAGSPDGSAPADRWVRTLLDTTDAIWAVQAREELPGVAVEQGQRLIPGVAVGIGLRVPGDPGRMDTVAASLPALQPLVGGYGRITREGPGGMAMTGRPFETVAAGTFSERLRQAGVDTMRLVPLVSGIGPAAEPEPLGLLGFFRGGSEPFTELERHLMDEFAKRLSVALHRVQLLDTANRRARRLQTGVETAVDLASVVDHRVLVHRLVERTCDAVDADRVTLGRVEGDHLVVEDSFDRHGLPAGEGASWRIADHEALAAALGRQQAARQTGFGGPAGAPEPAAAFAGIEYVAAVPLVLGSRVEALLVVGRRRQRAFDDEDLATLGQLATVAVLLLRNVRLLEEARAASVAKSRFMNLAAHELRTPLAAIGGYASMLEDGTFGRLEEAQRPPVEAIVTKTAELGGLIEDILTASRLESGRLHAVPRRLDLCQAVREAVHRLEARLGPRASRLRQGLPAEPVWALADGQHVERILEVLVDNALKYADGAPDVLLSVAAEAEAVVRVEDRGIGIDPAQRELVFERFYRVDDTAATWFPSGTGLGLAIGRELAELNGGTVVLERSEPGAGSVFALRLPLA